MNSSRLLKTLKIISTIAAIAILCICGYFGYEFYQSQTHQTQESTPKIAESSPESNPIQSNTESNTQSSTEASPLDKITTDLDEQWASILDKAQNAKQSQEQDSKQDKDQNREQSKEQAQNLESSQPQNPKHSAKATKSKPQATTSRAKKPYLAIIMDDMAYQSQLSELKKLNLRITPSFFPVSEDSKDTAKMAKTMPFYMVHLPLEAEHAQHSHHQWILTGSSLQSIRDNIATIKKDFPNLQYINNHTGSKFSASLIDMQNLLFVLNEYGIDFVDSRTTPHTAAPEIYKQSKRALLYRDVFLDNEQSTAYTLKQLQLAISIAKKKGYAIAICHPHTSTFKALKIAKEKLFDEVELVYIKDLPIAQNRPPLHITISAENAEFLPHSQATKDSLLSESTSKTAESAESIERQRPSKIDQSVFEEVKRTQALQQKQNPKSKNPKSTSHNPATYTTQETITATTQECEQSEIEAFISGCPMPKGYKEQSGFINLQWSKEQHTKENTKTNKNNNSTQISHKPKDFLDIENTQ